MNLQVRDCRGSFTVEASLVISTILLLLVALMLCLMLLYQQVMLSWIAESAAQQTADIWADSRQNMVTGAWNREEKMDSLYYRLLDDALLGSRTVEYRLEGDGRFHPVPGTGTETLNSDSLLDRKFQKLVEQMHRQPASILIRPAAAGLRIEYQNRLVERKVTIILQQEVKVPFAGFAGILGGKGTITLTGRGTAVITEPAEFIRNTDLLVETVWRAGQSLDIGSRLDDLKDRLLHR
jgi:hypothetical protein